ncbi:MAG: TetR/AcrR family transcriptional regulator [Pseudomonadota bacterium]|nr:TetR/AcrR family transcriptional regulator [Pseudomonadota bacterium]
MQGRALSEAELADERKRLTAIALRMVDTEGRDACSLRGVAAAAGISRSTPYGYFADKEALLDAVRVAALHQLADGCEVALAEGTDVVTRLRGVGQAYLDFALEHPALYTILFEPVPPGPESAAAVARYRALAEAPLREAHALGLTVLPPERLAHVLWAATHGLIGLRQAGKLHHGISFETALADVRDTLAFGFVPRSAS